jgi:iron complex transport system permease protein
LKSWQVNAALGLSLPVLLVFSLSQGSTHIPWTTTLSSLAGSAANWLGLPPADATLQAIVRELRLPRALLSMMVGASLAMVGALLQTVTRNDLADPFLFGLSSGAAAGAVLVISFGGDWLGVWTLPMAAFAGGLLASVSVLLLAQRSVGQGAERIVIAGLAMSFLFGALTHVLVFAGDQRAAHSVLFWSLGGLGLARWDNLLLPLLGLTALCVFVLLLHRDLDALLAGDDTAHCGAPDRACRTQTIGRTGDDVVAARKGGRVGAVAHAVNRAIKVA